LTNEAIKKITSIKFDKISSAEFNSPHDKIFSIRSSEQDHVLSTDEPQMNSVSLLD